MKKGIILIFLILSLQARGSLVDELMTPSSISTLNEITKSKLTWNKIELLHLGVNSYKARQELLNESEEFVFTSTPYWFGDETGKGMLEAYSNAKERNSEIDMRIIQEWSGPGTTGDPLGLGIIRRIRKLTEKNVILFNNPSWQRNWSYSILRNRMHEKMLIVDGKKLIMGGMNYGDDYFMGGVNSKGWHDTDVLIQGGAVPEATKLFLTIWNTSKYLSSSGFFPFMAKQIISTFHEIFYNFKDYFKFQRYDFKSGNPPKLVTEEVNLNFRHYFKNTRYFPTDRDLIEKDSPVRLIYDSSLVDRSRETKKRFSKTRETIDFLLGLTKHSLDIFFPYPTITKDFKALLIKYAEKGIRIRILTNSLAAHDLGRPAYFGSVSHFEKLLTAGIEIYEWQGHGELLKIQEENQCEHNYWPGGTIHTKAMVFDGEVSLIGSHNFNVRSERFNTELISLVLDKEFSMKLKNIFEYDLDYEEDDPSLLCGDIEVPRPRRVEKLDLDRVREFVKKHKKKISFWKRMQHVL